MELDLHKDIKKKLDFFIESKKIPHIIFHGEHGSGKRTLLRNFIQSIYDNDKQLISTYVINIDCGHGKGIKFIRDELKFFAKANIHNSEKLFKSIILLNADKLTIDAQSALRRCIELFSHTTRFFIIVENKYKLLKPIISRFSEIYVSKPLIYNKEINLHSHIANNLYNISQLETQKQVYIKNIIKTINKNSDYSELLVKIDKLYNKGISGLDIINYITKFFPENVQKYKLLLTFNKVKKDIRNEKLLMFFILNFSFIRSDYNLENITFM